jgi:hypothetical protein
MMIRDLLRLLLRNCKRTLTNGLPKEKRTRNICSSRPSMRLSFGSFGLPDFSKYPILCFVLTRVFRGCAQHLFPASHERLDQLCRRGVRGTSQGNARTKFIAGNAVGDGLDSDANHRQLVEPSLHV